MATTGWFAMNRAMFEHPIFAGNPDRVAAWAWMIATAAWKDTRQNANGKIVVVKRGQLLTSYRQMSNATGVSVKSLRGLVERLRGGNAIDTDTGTGRLLITIRNYDKYQSPGDDRGTGEGKRRAHEGHTKEQGNKGTTLEAKASLSAKADDKATITEAVTAYLEMAKRQDWPSIHTLSKARKSALRARLRELGGIDGWRDALARAAASSHCNGGNDRGWVCNFDFLTRQSSLAKLMEGNYDDRNIKLHNGGNTGRSGPHDALYAGFAAFANRDENTSCGNFGGGEASFGSGEWEVDRGPGCHASKPIFRVIGSE